MQPQSERGSTADPASGAGQDWLGNSVWRAPGLEISGIKSWGSITAMSYHRAAGESTWRGDRLRIVLGADQFPPMLLQIEQGPTRQMPTGAASGLMFFPSGLEVRTVHPAARLAQVVWDTDLYSTLLPEVGEVASRVEFLYSLQDPLLSQIITTRSGSDDSGSIG